MAHFNGLSTYVSFAGNVISGDYLSVSWTDTQDLNDVSAGNDTSRSYITALTDATIDLEWMVENSAAGGTILEGMGRGAEGTLIIGPEGTAAGEYQYSCVAIVKQVQHPITFNESVKYSYQFQKTGDWISNPETGDGAGTFG